MDSQTYSIQAIKKQLLPLLSHIASPHRELAILLEHIANIPYHHYIAEYKEYELSHAVFTTLSTLVHQRARGIPSAYLVQKKEFYNEEFMVNNHVLIPRPETELILDIIFDIIQGSFPSSHISNTAIAQSLKPYITTLPPAILDCGTGSGVIGTTLAKKLIKSNIHHHITLSDISTQALHCAKYNAAHILQNPAIQSLTLDNTFISLSPSLSFSLTQGFLLDSIHNSDINYGIIAANLPYLAPHHMPISDIAHEPSLALEGSSPLSKIQKHAVIHSQQDGLALIATLFQQASHYTHPHMLVLEADPLQFDRLSFLAAQYQYTIQGTVCDIKKYARVFYCLKD